MRSDFLLNLFSYSFHILGNKQYSTPLPLALDVLCSPHWSAGDLRVLLTGGKSPQRALDIQKHLVVVLVIFSLYRFWRGKNVAVSLTSCHTRLAVSMDLLQVCFVMRTRTTTAGGWPRR